MEELLLQAGALLLTFLLGLVIPSPIYAKVKITLDELNKSLGDGKITAEEIEIILNVWKKNAKTY